MRDAPASDLLVEDDQGWLRQYHGAVILATVSIDGEDLPVASIYAPMYEVKGKALEGLDRIGLTFGGRIRSQDNSG